MDRHGRQRYLLFQQLFLKLTNDSFSGLLSEVI
jgi:hypothetical protein